MHRCVNKPGVIVVSLNISWTVEPIDAERIYALLWVVVNVDEFHNAAQIVGFSRRLAYKVHLICSPNQHPQIKPHDVAGAVE